MRPKAKAMMDKLSLTLRKGGGAVKTVQKASEKNRLIRVDRIRHWSTPTYTRVVIDIERPIKYESHLLKPDPDHNKPRRLYVDLKAAFVSADIDSTISIRDGLLQTARAGQYKKDTVRVVLDINSFSGYKIFHLHDPFRIVVDVQGQSKGQKKTIAATTAKKRPARKGIRKPDGPEQDVSLAQQLGLNVKRIVIDPGHGGKDPGTYYKGGIKEKDIVLKLAKVLAQKIESRLGCEATLTRTTDRFIPLERRTAFANVQKADLFVSLHINAHRKSSISGIETYYLNMATDERAVMVAAMENATSEKNISDLHTILNDLMLNTKISESSRLAHAVQKGMVDKARRRYKGVKSLGVKQAPFYVLIGAEMPAILLEIGFMTNSTERKRLLNTTYLNLLADGVVSGIDRYVKSIDKAYGG
jgi:N-acetylmuramoyl-L-alanine amidase